MTRDSDNDNVRIVHVEGYRQHDDTVDGWPVTVTSYRMGHEYHCTVANVSPGAWLARATGPTREVAEAAALDKARTMLARTRIFPAA